MSEQKEQAVVSSTLILWRSLGMVLGVASSSLVVQNALVHYLKKFVIGPERDEVFFPFLPHSESSFQTKIFSVADEEFLANKVILLVRKSVHSIMSLSPVYKEQVIYAYTAALEVTFQMAVLLALGMMIIISFIRLPRLAKKE